MKKICILLIACFITLSCVGCKKQDDITNLSADLTNYELQIELDVDNKKAEVTQKVDYINNSENSLQEVKFHLYPQFFKEECIDYVVSNTRLNDAFPNGMNYSTLMHGLKVAGVDLNRKMLAEIAVSDKEAFASLCETAKAAL